MLVHILVCAETVRLPVGAGWQAVTAHILHCVTLWWLRDP